MFSPKDDNGISYGPPLFIIIEGNHTAKCKV